MPVWKVLFIMVLALICFVLALSTVVVPISMEGDKYRWLWLAGLLVATIVMGTLLALFLKNSDRTFKR